MAPPAITYVSNMIQSYANYLLVLHIDLSTDTLNYVLDIADADHLPLLYDIIFQSIVITFDMPSQGDQQSLLSYRITCGYWY